MCHHQIAFAELVRQGTDAAAAQIDHLARVQLQRLRQQDREQEAVDVVAGDGAEDAATTLEQRRQRRDLLP